MKNGYRKHNFRHQAWNSDFRKLSYPAETIKPTSKKIEYAPFKCPSCNSQMVKRFSKKNNKHFYGCVKLYTKYKCKGTRDLDGSSLFESKMAKYKGAMIKAESKGSIYHEQVGKSRKLFAHGKIDIDSSKEQPQESVLSEKWLYDEDGQKIRRL